MKRVLTIAFVIILMSSSLGCLDNPTPPGSERPRLVMDLDSFVNGTSETIVYLQSMDPVRYNNITLTINGTVLRNKRDSFSLEYRFSRTHFRLSLDVEKEEKAYNFNATFVLHPSEDIVYKVIYYDGDKRLLKEDDIPFIEPLNRKEEDEI